jgi:hypothetical protein
MTIDQAAKLLAQMYRQGAATNEKAVYIHLFGIKYADELEGMSLPELTDRAGISDTYKTEIRKGMNLAKYVQLKA